MPNWTKEQQTAIYEKDKNIIVSAGAGSGKTAVLTERVLTHLKNNVSIDNLLILTFTNAAAAEMKERIRKKIKDIKELKQELDKIDTASITTFDAYSLSLVKKYSHILGISKDIKIADNTFMKLKKEKFLNEIFEEYYKEENKFFLKLIDDFTEKDDKEIKANILTLQAKISNLYNKDDFLDNYVDIYYTKAKIEEYINDYDKFLKDIIKEISEKANDLTNYTDEKYTKKLYNSLNPLINSTTYEEIKTNIISIPRLPNNSEEEAKKIKKELSDLLKQLNQYTTYENKEEIENSINKTKDYAIIIIEIIKKLNKKINEYKEKKNTYEFIDISDKAIKLLKENKEIREELKNNYYEILIDEYQDTNDIQESFISLIEKNNVYMVGDIKQSIYRFRNTNPKLFKSKYNLYSKGEKGLKIDLNKNFRSRNDVIEGINKIFDYIMDENIGGAEYRQSHRMIFGNLSYNEVNKENYSLEILNYKDDENYTKEEIEIFTVAKDIKEKIENKYQIMDDGKARNITYKDFAILMDRSTSFEKYKQIFEYLGIPLNIYKDKKITNTNDILIIKNLYNLIIKIYENKIDKEFKYSYMSISRSFLFETSDDEIFNTLQNPKETELYKKCKKISQYLEELTNYDLIDKIINEFNFYQKIIKDQNIKEHITIIDSIKKIGQTLDELGYTPKDFLNYLNEILEKELDISIKINKGNENSVKIMTIHASKGLEYPVCYYTGLSKKFNIDDLKQKFYLSNNYGIITPYKDDEIKQTILKDLLRKEYIKEEVSEKLRLFYVALTRAREKMIIVTDINEKELKSSSKVQDSIRLKYLSFKDIIDSVSSKLTDNIKKVDNKKLNLTKKYLSSKKNFNKEIFLINEPFVVSEIDIETKEIKEESFSKKIKKLQTKEETKNIEQGLHMHKIFEDFDFKLQDYSELTQFEERKVKSFINKINLNDIKDIYKEYEFIYEKEDKAYHGIIDLLLVKEKQNIIVDYKLKNTKDELYINQLNGYKKYIESITNKPTKIYLYSILDERLEEI